ncbi:hypothetical protein A5730_18715 [Mycobacterium sp. ACS4054]|nr:hypothetical protein A5730_18715 [Mycobacterium sp. ACS4054]
MPDRERTAKRTVIRRASDRADSNFARRLIGPVMIAAMVTALFGAPDTRPQLPPGCAIGWTMVGGVLIYVPDCTHRSPAPPPPPDGPPPNPAPPPADQ